MGSKVYVSDCMGVPFTALPIVHVGSDRENSAKNATKPRRTLSVAFEERHSSG